MKNCENCRFNSDRSEFDLKKCKKCSRTDRAYFEPIPNAASIMEGLMKDGTYPSLNNIKSRLKTIQKTMEKELSGSESKRHEFSRYNVVAKFVPKKINSIDYEGLNEFLYNVGLLLPVVKIDHKQVKKDQEVLDILECYQLEPTYYVKPNFNKKGKELNQADPFEIEGWSLDHLAGTYSNLNSQLEHYKFDYEKAKLAMLECKELLQDKKLSHEFGSVSLIANDPLYNVPAINEELGEDFLIKYGKPDTDKLDYFITKGTISKRDIEQFKTVTDIRLDFIVMELDKERRMLEMLHNKTIRTGLNLMRA
ncbi:hypothetical protein [Bacillus sp. AFS040349]|uniref:hypothetical protein n=1 Tax=Bacillus sp. AFS040349 TaxID=2033502 RepID=UPI000BFE7BD7|nr:hypothetical protein [Bacillus sp. AFS040349]PGT83244.1 hypothetical protein COD11_12985 [Bacillus sp. AFS040349]